MIVSKNKVVDTVAHWSPARPPLFKASAGA